MSNFSKDPETPAGKARKGSGGYEYTGPEVWRAVVIHPDLLREASARAVESRLEEAVGLARAIDLEVRWQEAVRLTKPKAATLFGGGVVERIAEVVKAEEIDIAVVDSDLSPVQQRNLEKAWDCKVIDRTGLILEIFGARAQTHEGRLQVELAALNYQRSRLVRSWTHLERQRGGAGFMGGPGERQIELDRRLIDERIVRIKGDLKQVARTRGLHRDARQRVPFPVVALVGYTNAGKSTLFNRLTHSAVFAKDLLFATLDPTMRRLTLPSGQDIILSDTVGFISNLPTHLVAAFRATLEEVLEADLILHVRDIAHEETQAQKQDVETVLLDLGIDPQSGKTNLIEVWNKIDLLSPEERERVLRQATGQTGQIAVSAVEGTGLKDLTDAIEGNLSRRNREVELDIDLSDGATIAWLYEHGQVKQRSDDERHAHLRVSLDPRNLERLARRPGVQLSVN